MSTGLRAAWATARDSLWLVPAVLTLAGALLAMLLMVLERSGVLWTGEGPGWLYQGDAEAARMVLSSITGSLITVTGVIFSATIVAVQLASSQYTPRVLRNFISDRGSQVVLGIFIGTFTYGVLVLRTIRSEDARGGEFIPRLAVTGAVALLLLCVAALIYFINHLAQEIRVTNIIDRIAKETVGNVHRLFPEHLGRADDAPPTDPRLPEHGSVPVRARGAGYIQFVDEHRLFGAGAGHGIVIGMVPSIGDYVLPDSPLALVRADGGVTPELEESIRGAFVLGPERTPWQDVEFGMIQISDVAIKALSPSLNDPTTAIRCIDRLGQVLAELGTRKPPEARRTRDGRVRFVASYTTLESAVKVAFDDIRHFGSSVPLIAEHLLDVLAELVTRVPGERREPLVDQAQAVLHSALEQITNPRDLASIRQAAERFAGRTGVRLGEAGWAKERQEERRGSHRGTETQRERR
jgi:uncharacterized membrane protein